MSSASGRARAGSPPRQQSEGARSPLARSAWTWTRRIAPWALAVLVLALVAQQARSVDWSQVWMSLQKMPPERLALAAGIAVVSYVVYAGFDLVGRHLTRHGLPVPLTLGTAAISYAFNLNFGALVGGFAMRLRLYTRWGVSGATVAEVIAMSMTTNWLGYLWVSGVVLLWSPPALPGEWAIGHAVLRAIGAAMVLLALLYLGLCAWSRRRTLNWREHELALPDGRLAVVQALAGGASWMLMGAIVWVLFAGRIDYPVVLGTLLLAAVAGVITHVPAGLGVLEAVFVAMLAGKLPTSEVLAVVLAYRATYYLLPLVLALPAYGWSEAVARRLKGSGRNLQRDPGPAR